MWNELINLTQHGLLFLQLQFGLSDALAIVVFVSLIRLILLPVSLKATYQQYVQRAKLARLSPQLATIKSQGTAVEQMQALAELRKANGINLVTPAQLMNGLGQSGIGITLFASLKQWSVNSTFYWIENIAKPDYLLALCVSLLTFMTMMLTPGEVHWYMAMIPALVAIVALMSFPATIAISYGVSAFWTMLQSAICQWYLRHQKVENMS
ncbi:YidC/Oxa1 family membrane protein insertase [Shewanella waksmanii]|uniref:YidC/Oxa1 family membrane protein insertase n=1 Tax=Shewanella waksmanii TaxID=213783 RepID=UPI003734D46E